ncbi:hypothetical protein NQ314_011564 [Rhamnusium bicolor]|uniref:MULE transposase domain-containing protein n=1 Tax=Rhamnusium bicolor TaxID=1586634 RepID=A0AAV8XGZ7_9CUCU|nr:hypothetical protein NQ314_011564 [Rhamnusium bicolor]
MTKGVEVIIKEHPLIIVILTPIIKRAHEQSFSKDIVFVDSSGSCDQMNTCVTFMYAASKIGAIPLACMLHTAQTESNYTLAFSVLKEYLSTNGFGGLGYPLLFMTDDSASERNALSSIYPSSRLLLCLFHLAQALWRWLWASENHILNEDRKPIMNMFRSIIYSSCIEEAESQYDIMLTENRCKKYPHLMAHIASIWERRTE